MNKEMKELNQYREWMYRFLASVFIQEIDEAMLASMQKMTFPAFPETNTPWQQDLNAGFRLIESYLAGFEGKSEEEVHALLEDLAADYAKVFLAAGDAAGKAAFPYESIYTGFDSAFGGSLQMNLSALYASKGLTMREDMFKIMEDHIGLELNFMAELLKEESDASDEATADDLRKQQCEFFQTHLINWAAQFAADIYKYTERDFYKGVARMTMGFMEAEQAFFRA
ncbi:MAG: molecular chaperone TorD family protein [Lachnospiraceae bacterium]|nr:molecular chaperone TorD family protein [Lachnospiraceae bacterium]